MIKSLIFFVGVESAAIDNLLLHVATWSRRIEDMAEPSWFAAKLVSVGKKRK